MSASLVLNPTVLLGLVSLLLRVEGATKWVLLGLHCQTVLRYWRHRFAQTETVCVCVCMRAYVCVCVRMCV